MRHGQAVSNVKRIASCWKEKFKNPLTTEGKKSVKKSAQEFKKNCDKAGIKIDLMFVSPLLRTKMTADISEKILGLRSTENIKLREQDFGVFNGLPIDDLHNFFGEKTPARFKIKPKGGKTYKDIEKRMVDFLKRIDKKYKNKNILFVSHEMPLLLLDCAVKGIKNKDFYKKREKIKTAEIKKLNC
jgi:broad specificity phosphatase PhoE